jgi:hypothetical protein
VSSPPKFATNWRWEKTLERWRESARKQLSCCGIVAKACDTVAGRIPEADAIPPAHTAKHQGRRNSKAESCDGL